ncbi:MAG: hypothetical protein Q9208_002699 [Pyrenodesmia sp. 3 TL-2023]
MSEHDDGQDDGRGRRYNLGNLPDADGSIALPLTEHNLAAIAEGPASSPNQDHPRDADGFVIGGPELWMYPDDDNHSLPSTQEQAAVLATSLPLTQANVAALAGVGGPDLSSYYPDDDACSLPSTQEQAAVLATSLPLTQANVTALAGDEGPDLSVYPDDALSFPSTQEQASVLATLPLTEANLVALAGNGGPDLSIYPVKDINRSLYPETQSQASRLQQEPHDLIAPHGSQPTGDPSADHVMDGGPNPQSQGEDPPGYELDGTPVPNPYGFGTRGELARDTASSVDTVETEVYHLTQEEYERTRWRGSWFDPPDERIWARLPHEIKLNILEQSDRKTLISWSCTARLFYDLASTVLWKRIRLRPSELMGYSTRSRLERQNRADTLTRASDLMMNFLAEEAFRHPTKGFWLNIPGALAKAPNERIKCVEVDLLGSPYVPYLSDSKKIRRTVSRLVSSVPNLRDLTFEGMLDPETFGILVGSHDLHALTIRRCVDLLTYLRPTQNGAGQLTEWNQTLDLSHLCSLTNLRRLAIGRLVPREVRGLAKAVVDLSLTYLSISAAPPAIEDDWDYENNFRGDWDDESPLLTLLKLIPAVRRNEKSAPGCLPRSLRTLGLRDHYRKWKPEQILHHEDSLLEAVNGCRNLTHLEIRVKACTPLQHFLQHVNLPSLRYFSLEGCQHSLDWTDWAKLGLGVWMVLIRKTPPSKVAYALRDFLRTHRATLTGLNLSQTYMGPANPLGHKFALTFNQTQLSWLWDTEGRQPPKHTSRAQQNWESGGWAGHCCDGVYCFGKGDDSTSYSYVWESL